MSLRSILTILVVFLPFVLLAQSAPEQDCFGALSICSPIYTQTTSYTGYGTTNTELPAGNCLTSGENNSVWYIFTTSTAGYLAFTITPLAASDDYDFALFDLTGHTCADIATGVAPTVRCDYALSPGIATGIGYGGSGTTASASGNPLLDSLVVTPNQTFALLINNFTSAGQGYTIDFSGGTSFVQDTLRPFMDTITTVSTCDSTTLLTVHFSRPILCSSIDADGSCFNVTGPSPVTVAGAYSIDCISGRFTSTVNIRLGTPIETQGNYLVGLQVGTDGDSVKDVCGHGPLPNTVIYTQKAIVKPDFSWTYVSGCGVDSVIFQDQTLPIGNATSYSWDFGDGTSSTDQDPRHLYPDTGSYQVILTAASVDCSKSDTLMVHVGRSLTADFTFAPLNPCPGQTVQFTDSVNGSSNLYFWDFGDAQISPNNNPTHVYADSGTYNIKFVATINSGGNVCTDSVIKSITVNPLAQASFTTDPTIVCQGSPVVFRDSSSGNPTSWNWDFGNGSTSTQQNVSTSFDSIGTFNVTLSVTNVCNTDDTSQQITVKVVPSFELGTDTMLCSPDSILLVAYPGADSILWSTGETTDSIYFSQTPADVHVRVVKDGCSFETSRRIDQQEDGCIKVHLPTAFSPNGDGIDDYFRLVSPDRIQDLDIKIYNRWGQLVYHETKLNFKWDGTFKGEKVPSDVYVWYMLVSGLSGQNEFYKGNVTVIR